MKTEKQIRKQLELLNNAYKIRDIDKMYKRGYENALNWVLYNE
jgi:hypothetical protein